MPLEIDAAPPVAFATAVTVSGSKSASVSFSAGLPSPDDVRAVVHHFRVVAWWWHRLLEGFIRLPKPVLAAVNGAAAGSGLGMVLCSDLAVAKESARFMCAWHAIGIANDATTSSSLSKIVGFRRAMELMLTNRTLSSAEALEWGMVNRVFPDDEFDGQVKRIARDSIWTARQTLQWKWKPLRLLRHFSTRSCDC